MYTLCGLYKSETAYLINQSCSCVFLRGILHQSQAQGACFRTSITNVQPYKAGPWKYRDDFGHNVKLTLNPA